MTPEEKRSLVEFAVAEVSAVGLLGAASRERLRARFRPDAVHDASFVSSVLREALRSQDADEVECALYVANIVGLSPQHAGGLRDLILETWHRSHEALVSLLDDYRDPRLVDAFYTVATAPLAYLCDDEAAALTRRAAWALGNIWNEQAGPSAGDGRVGESAVADRCG